MEGVGETGGTRSGLVVVNKESICLSARPVSSGGEGGDVEEKGRRGKGKCDGKTFVFSTSTAG